MHSILAVDDSASMRQMVSFTLKSAGYNVVEAVDGQDAWEKAGNRSFDLVLTDQNMPRMDGIRKSLSAEVSQCHGACVFKQIQVRFFLFDGVEVRSRFSRLAQVWPPIRAVWLR